MQQSCFLSSPIWRFFKAKITFSYRSSGIGNVTVSVPSSGWWRFFSVASNKFFTSILDFLHIRKCAFTVSAPADQRQPQIRTLTFVRIPAALDDRRRVRVRPQRRCVKARFPVVFCTFQFESLLNAKKPGLSKSPGFLQCITLSVPSWAVVPAPDLAEAARSAPARCAAAFPPHMKVSRHPPAQTHRHPGSWQAVRLKRGADG